MVVSLSTWVNVPGVLLSFDFFSLYSSWVPFLVGLFCREGRDASTFMMPSQSGILGLYLVFAYSGQ
jgi:hypothetical protein